MTFLLILLIVSAAAAGIASGRRIAQPMKEVRARVWIPAAIGVALLGVQSMAVKAAGTSGASHLLAGLALAGIVYSLACAATGHICELIELARKAPPEEESDDGEPSTGTGGEAAAS
ncbi:Uncharacterised protein (plasmid) [Tsukamurella tyrosinosolvens]|uniref:Uncharacterized protein n=1 Tax=Tsukamurella tyrosinosolvens TaxID=57704 RepID=A0A1H4U584_TSUTY|nr:hypothetical protein [Tsukamurella tyrosinosolvens]KXO93019.1 hypothetical protein AXK58_14205 [Tsukamurella tyrosinosolvens]SEC63913.1 hypothetical protein SAMN04489793_2789 [Tsukamurella tyrosinosolvens]VEH94006.1 Uncharacterised protein [Tsukamurella tyrosinosolvens]